MRLLTASVLCVLFGSSAAFADSNASNDTGRSSKTAGNTAPNVTRVAGGTYMVDTML